MQSFMADEGRTKPPPPSARARPIVLVLLGAFWPGNDSTGPNQSFRALAAVFGKEFDFKVIARDRPFGTSQALAATGEWVDRGFARFRYCKVSPLRGALGLGDILRTTPHDVLMMNGFFDREFTIPALILRRLGKVPRRPTILSTRGEFAGGALGLKNGRKRAYRALARGLRLHHDIWFHATGPIEADDVRKVYPYARQVLTAPNVRQLSPLPVGPEIAASPDLLRLAFLGRITRVKNVDYALDVLSKVRSLVAFDIYGPVQDVDYWKECCRICARLPPNITVTHKGEIANDAVPATLAGYDLFFLPTMGENFGHAILDALAAGIPVMISDKTPFQDLERQGAGWSLPLGEKSRFVDTIETVAVMSSQGRSQLRTAARRFAERMIGESDAVAMNREMMRTVLSTDANRWKC